MKKLVVANWKMNPTNLVSAKKLFSAVLRGSKTIKKTNIVICPPFVYLQSLLSSSKKISLGAQDVYFEEKGAFTGEISPEMLYDLRLTYVIVGHSERRRAGETNEIVGRKLTAILSSGLDPILCIGEESRDAHGEYLSFLTKQIVSALKNVPKKDLKYVTVAYEPLWAIGRTEKDAIDAHVLHQTSLFIRKVLTQQFGAKDAKNVRIIYGGSVEPENATDLIQNGGVSGFLVGHASLSSKTFLDIIRSIENA